MHRFTLLLLGRIPLPILWNPGLHDQGFWCQDGAILGIKIHQLLSFSIDILHTNCVIIYSWLGWTISASFVGEEHSIDDKINILLFFIKRLFFFDNRVKYIIRMNRVASTKFASGSVVLILVFLMWSWIAFKSDR